MRPELQGMIADDQLPQALRVELVPALVTLVDLRLLDAYGAVL